HAQHHGMQSKDYIVEADSGLRTKRVTSGVLAADKRRGIKASIGQEVAEKAEDVKMGKCGGAAGCGATAEVEDGLRVKGERPGEGAGADVRGRPLRGWTGAILDPA
ncbi:MAG: hypothetical protein Q9190_007978, partial [Brigantiaea leucoxantha]